MRPGLYAILNLPHPSGLDPIRITALLLERGPAEAPLAALQLRWKRATSEQRAALLERLAPRCAAAAVPLIVNDDIAAAQEAAPDIGLHLGHEDLQALCNRRGRAAGRALLELRERVRGPLGLSTHTAQQVRAAQTLPLDYLGFGPVFSTRSKHNPDPEVGLAGLRAACRESQLPVVAIGGLDPVRGAAALAAGATAVAMISALAGEDAADIRARLRACRAALREND